MKSYKDELRELQDQQDYDFRLLASGLCGMTSRYTFERFETPEKWQESAKKKAIEFAESCGERWFVISGTPGTGKTHLCTSIARELIRRGKDVLYIAWRSEAPHLKALVNEREEYEREIKRLQNLPVLYIDDFFKGTVTAADVNLAFEILNSRYNSERTTIISTEKTVEEILDIDEAIGSRIYERSRGYCIKTPSQNWRLR